MERRQERRGLTYLGGKLSFNQGRSVVDCLVRNISSAGALVVFPDRTPIPDDPDLHIKHRDQSFRTTVVWRGHDRAGVALAAFRFEEIATSLDEVRRRKALRAENRRLRKQLDYMT